MNGWYRLVKSYTSRNLTVGTDKLPALSGLISTLEEKCNAQCYAGLWLNRDLDDLCWQVDHESRPATRPAQWRAPSWSFASLDGTVWYEMWMHENKYATLLDVAVLPASADPHGELLSGHIILKAPMFQLYDFEMIGPGKLEAFAKIIDPPMKATSFTVKIFLDVMEEPTCSALWLDRGGGLAVVPTGNADGEYRRVGLVKAWYGRTENSVRPIDLDVERLDLTVCTLV